MATGEIPDEVLENLCHDLLITGEVTEAAGTTMGFVGEQGGVDQLAKVEDKTVSAVVAVELDLMEMAGGHPKIANFLESLQ